MLNFRKIHESKKGKASDKWDSYLDIYDKELHFFQNKEIQLLEIGVQNGGSLEVFADYFPKAKLILGCDINKKCGELSYDDKRIDVLIGDATERDICNQIKSKGEFDIILDDGAHDSCSIIKSFCFLFETLSCPGKYIIEDLHCSYWKEYQGGLFFPDSSMAFLKKLSDIVNHEHWNNNKSRIDLINPFLTNLNISIDESILSQIKSIKFFNSICIIEKDKFENNSLGLRNIAGEQYTVLNDIKKLAGINNISPVQGNNPWSILNVDPEREYYNLVSTIDEYKNKIKSRDKELEHKKKLLDEQKESLEIYKKRIARSEEKITTLIEKIEQKDRKARRYLEKYQKSSRLFEQTINKLNEIQCRSSWQLAFLFRYIEVRWPAITRYTAAVPKLGCWLLTSRFRKRIEISRIARTILNQGLFDVSWYITQNPEIVLKGVNPILHWVSIGWREGRSPSVFFNVAWYLQQYPEVVAAGVNPLEHYLKIGAAEGKNPNPLFHSSWYLAQYPEVKELGINPLSHYIQSGWREGKDPNPLFHSTWYLQEYPDVAKDDVNPLQHFILCGAEEGRNPCSDFNTRWYQKIYPECIKQKINPLAYYFLYGQKRFHFTNIPSFVKKLPLPQDQLHTVQKYTICVVAHIFFLDLVKEIQGYLKNIPYRYDLLVSTDSEEKALSIQQAFKKMDSFVGSIEVRVTPNIGRNCAPLIVEFGHKLLTYDYVCHVHTKKSTHAQFGKTWRQHIFNNLLGSNEIVQSVVSLFEEDYNLGVIFPFPHDDVLKYCHWGLNKDVAKRLLLQLNVPVSILENSPLLFPAGGMFWFRPQALKQLLNSGLSWYDFPSEPIPKDGTISHAIERCICYLANFHGYTTHCTRVLTEVEIAQRNELTLQRSWRHRFIDSFDAVAAEKYVMRMIGSHAHAKLFEDKPRVSIILPTHNRKDLIGRAIESVLSQTYPYWELLIVDDGSNDGTVTYLEGKFDDSRIQIISIPHGGVAVARNAGLKASSGDYIAYIDSDNSWRKNYLEIILTTLLYHSTPCAYAALEVQKDYGQYFRGASFDRKDLLIENYIDLNIFIHCRSFYEKVGDFDPSLKRMVDWDFILRCTQERDAYFAPFIGAQYDDSSRGDRISRREDTSWLKVIRDKHNIMNKESQDYAHIIFYPDYSSTNPYQNLIYKHLGTAFLSEGGTIHRALALTQSSGMKSVIFHLHWTSTIAVGETWEGAEQRISAFLADLDRFLEQGGVFIWTVHNLLSHESKYPELEKNLCQELSHRAKFIHIHSQSVVDLAKTYFNIPAEKAIVGHHGTYKGVYPDTISQENARKQLKIPQTAKVFLFLGQIRAYKGIDNLLSAFKETVRKTCDKENIFLVIAGKPVEINIEEFQEEIKDWPNIRIIPQEIPDEKLQVFLRAANWMVLPYTQVLTSGSVYLGIAYDLPIIAPNKGLLGEVIRNKETGLLYGGDKSFTLQKAFEFALQLPTEMHKRFVQATKKVSAEITWQQIRRKLLSAYTLSLLPNTQELHQCITGKEHCTIARPGNLKGDERVGVVILHYENLRDTIRCIDSVLSQEVSVHIIAVSNDDNMDAFLAIARLFPQITIIQADGNLGYAGGNNLGLHYLKDKNIEDILILNPDALIPYGELSKLLDYAAKFPKTHIVGPRIMYGDTPEVVWFGGGSVSYENGLEAKHLYQGEGSECLPLEPFAVDYITGACILFHRDLIDTIGYFPEEYFLYFEETDWCTRAKREGATMTVVPDVEILHFKRSSVNNAPTLIFLYYYIRNAILFCKRFAPEKVDLTEKRLHEKVALWLQQVEKGNPSQLEESKSVIERAFHDGSRGIKGIIDLFNHHKETNKAEIF